MRLFVFIFMGRKCVFIRLPSQCTFPLLLLPVLIGLTCEKINISKHTSGKWAKNSGITPSMENGFAASASFRCSSWTYCTYSNCTGGEHYGLRREAAMTS